MAITSYGVKGIIGQALAAASPPANTLAAAAYRGTTELAPGQIDDLAFLGAIPAVGRWIDTLNPARPAEYKGTARVEKYALPINLPNDWLKADKSGSIDRVLGQVQPRLVGHDSELVAYVLNNGATLTCFDGIALFSDSHTFGKSGTIDNNLTYAAATGTTPTALEAANAIFAAWAAMLGFKDDQGAPVNQGLTKLGVVVGPEQAAAHAQACNRAAVLSDGSGPVDNPLSGLRAMGIEIQLLASALFTDTDGMVLLNMSPGAAPIVVLENIALRDVYMMDRSATHDDQLWTAKLVKTYTPGLFTDAVLTTYT